MARRQSGRKPRSKIGNRSRLDHRKMLKLFDRQTEEFIANIRWRRHGEVFVEPAEHVKAQVVIDPQS